MTRFLNPALFLALAAILADPGLMSAADDADGGKAEEEPRKPALVALAPLRPAAGSHVYGTVLFVQQQDGVRVIANVTGLSPGRHGFHVHEKGDLSAPDLTSAGGHFNPGEMPHGARTSMQRHVGDLGNLVADDDGVAKLDLVDPHLALFGEHSIVGRAVIVHEDEDDLKTQPTGAAGGRIAGGVITLQKDLVPPPPLEETARNEGSAAAPQ